MALIDKIIESAIDAKKSVDRIAGKAMSVAKIRTSITDKKSELKKLYHELGMLAHRSAKGEALAEAIEDKIAEIDLVCEALAELEEALCDARDMAKCPSCGETITAGSAFCSSCGAEIEQDE